MKLGWVIAALLLWGCSEQAAKTCVQGDARECLGLNENGPCDGVQFCLADGSGYDECLCNDPTAATASSLLPAPSNNPMNVMPLPGPGPTDGVTETDDGTMETDVSPIGTEVSETDVVLTGDVSEMPTDTGEEPPIGPEPTDPPEPPEMTDPDPPEMTDQQPQPEIDAGPPEQPPEPENAPVVVFLLDQSSSMFSPVSSEHGSSEAFGSSLDNWEGVRTALSGLDSAVAGLEVGLMSYTGQIDGTCPFTQTILVPGVSSSLSVTYTLPSGSDAAPPFPGQTPTGEALQVAVDLLLSTDLPGEKHVILVTDGDPDTCLHPDPQCGQDFTVSVAQQAKASGITVHAVGVTTAVQQPFLESLAYAGRGLPIPPPLAPEQQDCLARQAGSMGMNFDPNNWRASALTEYATDGTSFGESLAFTATNETELSTALESLLEFVRYGE